ncbi:unnamed protein product [Bemisia tabaci]|uniref:3'-5' exonuclease domain-containing protein n=1 Tax=Bemisia tabaci TaxID=7038 RepID=A0A9P0ADU3_BEMTA|nr:unnamed protein product [Bemisia tabaci]
MSSSSGKKSEEPYILIDENFNPKKACKKLLEFFRVSRKFPVIGLDCEWTQSKAPSLLSEETDEVRSSNPLLSAAKQPNIRNPVAILQLATKDGPTFIIRLRQIIALTDDNLDWQIFLIRIKDLLKSTDVLKVGVAIHLDTSRLLHDYQLHTVNCLDLQHIAAHYKYPKSGLTYLAKRLCDIDLPKFIAWQVDWDGPVLSPEALRYAAADAKSAVLIFEKFLEQSVQETKQNPSPVKNCADFINLWRFKIDVVYRYKGPPSPDKEKAKDGDSNSEGDAAGENADVTGDVTDPLPPIHPAPTKLLLGNPENDSRRRDLKYRTCCTRAKHIFPHPKMTICVLIIILTLLISITIIVCKLNQNCF